MNKGDYLGFLSVADSDKRMRIAAQTDAASDCLSLEGSEILVNNFELNSILTMPGDSCVPRRKYAIGATVCLSEDKDCLDRRVGIAGADDSLTYAYKSESSIAHIILNETIPRGDFIAWEIDVQTPSATIYPVVWQQINSTSYRIACTTLENDFHASLGPTRVKPKESCFINSDDYYVGFVDKVSDSRISYNDAMDSSIARTMLDLPNFAVIEEAVVHIAPFDANYPLIMEYIDFNPIPSYQPNRLYNIRAVVCNVDELCEGDHSIVSTNADHFGKIVITHEVSPRLITKVKIDVANVEDFDLLFFGKDIDGQIYLIHREEISPSTTGLLIVDFDPYISLGYMTNYIALNLSDNTPPPVLSNSALVNPVQLEVPSCYNAREGVPFPFTIPETVLGSFPISFCSVQQQLVGDWDPYFDGDRLKFVYKGARDYFVVTSDSLRTYIEPNAEITDLAAEVFEPGPVTFSILQPIGYQPLSGKHRFRMVDSRTFTATKSGVVKFSARGNPLRNVQAGSYLAVTMRKPIVPVTYANETALENGYIGNAPDGFTTPLFVDTELGPVKPFIQARTVVQWPMGA